MKRNHWWLIVIPVLVFLSSCPKQKPSGIPPLEGFSAKVSQLVTTSVRGYLRGDAEKQELLVKQLSSLEQKSSLDQVYGELESIEMKELAGRIKSDINFELNKSENQAVKNRLNEPDVQKAIVAAVIQGMRQAIEQLGGGGDGA